MASSIDSATSIQTIETKLADLLDSTLWNRRLAPSSERIVYALVQQIFHGIREYFLASTELKVCDMCPALSFMHLLYVWVCSVGPSLYLLELGACLSEHRIGGLIIWGNFLLTIRKLGQTP